MSSSSQSIKKKVQPVIVPGNSRSYLSLGPMSREDTDASPNHSSLDRESKLAKY